MIRFLEAPERPHAHPCLCPHHPLGKGPSSEWHCQVGRDVKWSHPSKSFQTRVSHAGEMCVSLISLGNLNFCIQDSRLNDYSWIHFLFPGWLYYVYIWVFFPFQLGKKHCRGNRHTHEEKILLWSTSVTCWKKNKTKNQPSPQQIAERI